jgi:ADP-dependent NAD(P)H-hydrate dehydratase / NAD(P)H-hydrate epimerase
VVSIIGPMRGPEERLPGAVYSAAQVRELDRIAIERYGIPGYELMCRAGEAALRVLRTTWPGARRVLVLCGAGNNAGDGYVAARLGHAAGLEITVVALVPTERLRGDAARAAIECRAAGVPMRAFSEDQECLRAPRPDVAVDALLGTGADRPLDGEFAASVAALNDSQVPVLSLDIPSGLDADTGLPLGDAVRAAVTQTFVGLKQGFYLGAGGDYTGRIEFDDLGIPAAAREDLRATLTRLGGADLDRALPKRPRSAHKGVAGRLLLLGGGPGMPGAIRLAAEGALRTGAGLVYVATHRDSAGAVLAGRPELICRAVDTPADLAGMLDLADAAVVGPGLGKSEWARPLLRELLGSKLPLVVDADGLNLLAEAPVSRGRWLLTPHPTEAARLLASTTDAVQRDRLGAVRELARRYDAVAVLKGACSLVAADGTVAVCDRGNPGMATAGMGDVLAGVLGALAVQTRDLRVSARAGVLLHALAGDAAAADGERGTVAADLMLHLKQWANRS